MVDAERGQPLVSVGIPLHRSRRFLDVIVENIEAALAYDNVEMIVSDRHGEDDALAVLHRRFGADRRFRFLSATDGLTWVEHYNLLLREARGKYAVLLAHDDSYPSTYIGELVAALEARSDAVLAFGRVELHSLDGVPPPPPFSPPPVPARAEWTLGASLRMLMLWQLWFAFRGMVRREVVQQSNLYLRGTRGTFARTSTGSSACPCRASCSTFRRARARSASTERARAPSGGTGSGRAWTRAACCARI